MNLKKSERYLRANMMGPGPRLMKKKNYRAAVSQRLRNTVIEAYVHYQGPCTSGHMSTTVIIAKAIQTPACSY